MFSFSEEVRAAYESMPVPLAYYQRDGDRIIPILVSDGLCKMMNADRPALIERLSSSMFERVHPDDAGRIARAVRDFAARLSGYNVVYRSNYRGDEDYRTIHSVGRYQAMPDGSDLGVFVYTDISDNESERNELFASYELSQRDRFYTDPVTGLPNINFMYEFASDKVGKIREGSNKPVLIYFDVNGLRSYNAQYGFEQGDELLRLIADIIKAEFPKGLIVRGPDDHYLVLTRKRTPFTTSSFMRSTSATAGRSSISASAKRHGSPTTTPSEWAIRTTTWPSAHRMRTASSSAR